MERAEEKGVEKAMTTRAENAFVSRVGEFYARALEKGFLPGPKPKGEQWQKFRALFSKDTRPLYMEIGRAPVELQSLMRISYAVFCLTKTKSIQEHLLYTQKKT